MDDGTVKIGLLLEAAESHQASAAAALEALRAHAAGLDLVVREEIRATLVEELQGLQEHCTQAAGSLRALTRHANRRLAALGAVVVLLASTIPLTLAWWLLPGPAEIAALRASRVQLSADLERLRREGGAIDLKRCGAAQRLCARVDRAAPRYGDAGGLPGAQGLLRWRSWTRRSCKARGGHGWWARCWHVWSQSSAGAAEVRIRTSAARACWRGGGPCGLRARWCASVADA